MGVDGGRGPTRLAWTPIHHFTLTDVQFPLVPDLKDSYQLVYYT